jgi:hypothetical protein
MPGSGRAQLVTEFLHRPSGALGLWRGRNSDWPGVVRFHEMELIMLTLTPGLMPFAPSLRETVTL